MSDDTPDGGVPPTRERVDYRFAATDARAAIDRAVKAECSDAEFRTLMGVIYLVSLYHRTEDHLWLPLLARTIGARPSMVGRHLKALHQAGVIEYYPAHGRGRIGSVVVPKGVREAPLLPAVKLASGTRPLPTKTRVWETENSRLGDRKLASQTRPALDRSLDKPLASATHDNDGHFSEGCGWIRNYPAQQGR